MQKGRIEACDGSSSSLQLRCQYRTSEGRQIATVQQRSWPSVNMAALLKNKYTNRKSNDYSSNSPKFFSAYHDSSKKRPRSFPLWLAGAGGEGREEGGEVADPHPVGVYFYRGFFFPDAHGWNGYKTTISK